VKDYDTGELGSYALLADRFIVGAVEVVASRVFYRQISSFEGPSANFEKLRAYMGI
jgi:hypothetical protein